MDRNAEAASRSSYDVAEARRRLSELLGRVAFGGESVVIARRGKPMARLVAFDAAQPAPHLAGVVGWLEDGDPFLADVDAIVSGRAQHRPRAVAHGSAPRRAGPCRRARR